MLVVDASDSQSPSQNNDIHESPAIHTAIRNLIDGLQDREDIEIFVLYGSRRLNTSEQRIEGCIHYMPISYRPIPFIPGIGAAFLGRALALWKALRKLNPDVVHAQGTERESGMVAAMSSFPSIITLHGNMRELARSMSAPRLSYFGIASILERWAIPRVSKIHCISRHTQESVSKLAHSTEVIPNAVSPFFFDIQNQPSKHPVVICMAGISEWKNPLLLLRASDQLNNEFPNTEVHFHGDCNTMHPYGKSFLDAISLRPWCYFHGKSSRQGMKQTLSRATCAVLPSKQENLPLAISEAMAAGVPCVASEVGGIPDMITHEKTGLMFPSDDEMALAECLLKIHRNPIEAQDYAKAARAEAKTRFSITAVANSHVHMYQELVSRS